LASKQYLLMRWPRLRRCRCQGVTDLNRRAGGGGSSGDATGH
jgi:hypothetical protein